MMHAFEKAGLGKAPFHCTHVVDSWSACQFCGTPIRYQYHIEGEDSSHFYVGSDCVAKTGGAGYVSNFKEVRTKLVREQRAMKAAARAEARKAQWAAEAAVKRQAFEANHPGVYETMKTLGATSNFCANMAANIERWGNLTPNQLAVAVRIMNETLEKERLRASGGLKVAGSLEPLVEMFKKAKQKLKYPKLTVQVQGSPYTFSLAADTSRNPGHIYVKRNGLYVGKVSPEGEFHGSRDADAKDREAVNEFSLNPVAVAGKHGHVTGNCCFCSKALTDQRSTEVGYGPVCAQNFGLPWG